MPKKDLPVYSIQTFNHEVSDFYANTLKKHLMEHHFIKVPHKHDFFLTVLFTKGTGTHEIDFTTYKVKPGNVFMLSPGQTHNWKLSEEADGYVFFHTRNFYDLAFTNDTIKQFPFFASIYYSPFVTLKGKTLKKLLPLFEEVVEEHLKYPPLSMQKIRSLITLIYIEITRTYTLPKKTENQNSSYLLKLRQLELLIDQNYKEIKLPNGYAELMNMSEKHLNRICKLTLNKTSTQVIADRIILESKRLLVQTTQSVNQVGENLGYLDSSYFSRFFKKHTGETPLTFLSKYRN